jgi:HAD superfamily hydrolase (TIGR01549 family)
VAKTLLLDLIDTVVAVPVKPREVLYKTLRLPNPQAFEWICHSICLKKPNLSHSEFFDEVFEEFKINGDKGLRDEIYSVWERSIESAHYLEGAVDTLKILRDLGYKLVIVSNTTPPTRQIIKRLGMSGLFHSTILSCDVGFLKPDPRIFRIAAESVSANTSDCCMVGDRWVTDIEGALQAGMPAIHIDDQLTHPVVDRNGGEVAASIPSLEYLPSIMECLELDSKE